VDDEAPTEERAPTAGPSRIGIAMVAVAGVLLIAAAVFVVIGLQADSDAQDDRHHAAQLRVREHTLATTKRAAELAAGKMDKGALDAQYQLSDLDQAIGEFAAAQNHFVDAFNRSATMHNQGDQAGATAVLNGDGAAGLAEMEAKNTALQQQLREAAAAVQRAAEALQ